MDLAEATMTSCPGKDSNTISCEESTIEFQFLHILPIFDIINQPHLHISIKNTPKKVISTEARRFELNYCPMHTVSFD